jgi:hypothetical protein
MRVSGQRHAPAALYPRRKDLRYPLYRRVGGPQSRSGKKARGKILSPLPVIEPWSPGRPVRSQTLYSLSYLGSILLSVQLQILQRPSCYETVCRLMQHSLRPYLLS